MSVQTIAKISILGALAFLVMMFEIPLPFAPEFYKLGFDEVIVLIGGFALGPWAAVCIEALKIALNLIIGGTITMGVGELTNFLIGLSFVLPATIIYQREKNKKARPDRSDCRNDLYDDTGRTSELFRNAAGIFLFYESSPGSHY